MTNKVPEISKSESQVEMSATTKAISDGAAAARKSVDEILPVLGASASRTVYGVCYYAAYLATFTALTLVRPIPTDSVVARGLHDGANAAEVDYEEHKAQQVRMREAGAGEGAG
jgi:hypothetical protein